MKAIQQYDFGGPEVLTVTEIPEPAPRAGRVRVRVTGTSVNPADLAARAGWLRQVLPDLAPPFILGADLAGTVIDGDGPFVPGTRVAGLAPWFVDQEGTYAEVVSIDPAHLAEIPDEVDDVTAAAVPITAETAWQALELGGLGAGQTVLVTGASGAIGGWAVQHAVGLGAKVVAVASDGDEKYVEDLGADIVLGRAGDAGELATAVRKSVPGGVDVVVDPAGIGGDLIHAVRDGGVFVVIAVVPAPEPERGVDVRRVSAQSDGALLARILADLADGTKKARIGLTLPLTEAAEAHRRSESRSVRGKIVLTV
ncbi:NADP-dependent oxidoreductase [Streptomyces sp. NPDC058256]|uniref:NADP-dependent oxidoreductase n=1 Tax=Streptomyces sp. NPDC058256 TaxID=3346408 RepID=UPI0036F1590E